MLPKLSILCCISLLFCGCGPKAEPPNTKPAPASAQPAGPTSPNVGGTSAEMIKNGYLVNVMKAHSSLTAIVKPAFLALPPRSQMEMCRTLLEEIDDRATLIYVKLEDEKMQTVGDNVGSYVRVSGEYAWKNKDGQWQKL